MYAYNVPSLMAWLTPGVYLGSENTFKSQFFQFQKMSSICNHGPLCNPDLCIKLKSLDSTAMSQLCDDVFHTLQKDRSTPLVDYISKWITRRGSFPDTCEWISNWFFDNTAPKRVYMTRSKTRALAK